MSAAPPQVESLVFRINEKSIISGEDWQRAERHRSAEVTTTNAIGGSAIGAPWGIVGSRLLHVLISRTSMNYLQDAR